MLTPFREIADVQVYVTNLETVGLKVIVGKHVAGGIPALMTSNFDCFEIQESDCDFLVHEPFSTYRVNTGRLLASRIFHLNPWARKGTVDTTLRTFSAGYLTKRSMDVAHEILISEENCKDKERIEIFRKDALV